MEVVKNPHQAREGKEEERSPGLAKTLTCRRKGSVVMARTAGWSRREEDVRRLQGQHHGEQRRGVADAVLTRKSAPRRRSCPRHDPAETPQDGVFSGWTSRPCSRPSWPPDEIRTAKDVRTHSNRSMRATPAKMKTARMIRAPRCPRRGPCARTGGHLEVPENHEEDEEIVDAQRISMR